MAAHISTALDAQFGKVNEQKPNLTALKKFVKDGKGLPNSRKPVLYALDGTAGLATVAAYVKTLQKARASNPKAVALCYVCDWTYELLTLYDIGLVPLFTDLPTHSGLDCSNDGIFLKAYFDKAYFGKAYFGKAYSGNVYFDRDSSNPTISVRIFRPISDSNIRARGKAMKSKPRGLFCR